MTNQSENPLDKLRAPFPEHHISKLPKETGAQAKARKAAQDAGNWPPKCDVCGGYHHAKAVHLDYVGHAALTDRLLDTDMNWYWEPVAFTPEGLPAFDRNNGLWIRLTVCGVTRLGYGAADGKTGGDAIKEIIGDALRNAAMRFGAALDLWHKGDLHVDNDDGNAASAPSGADNNAPRHQQTTQRQTIVSITPEHELMLVDKMREAGVGDEWLKERNYAKASDVPESKFQAAMKALNDIIASKPIDDEIPY